MKFGSTCTRRTNESDCESLIIRHRNQCSFAVTRESFDTDLFCVHGLVRLEVIECTTCAPGPRTQRTPVVQLARVALIAKANYSLGKTGTIVGLNGGWNQTRVSPTLCEQLLLPCWSGRWCWGICWRRGRSKSWWKDKSKLHHHWHWSCGISGSG